MRFIIHNTDNYNKPEFIELRRRAGLSGYGAWWSLLELIAGSVDKDNPPEIQITTGMLAERLGKQCRTIPKLLADFVECGLIELRIGNRVFSKHSENIFVQIENELKTFSNNCYYLSIANFSKYKGKYKNRPDKNTREYNRIEEEKKESFFSSPKGREKKDSNLPYSPTLGENAAGGPALGGAPPPLSPAGGCSSHPQSDTRELSTVEREAAFKKAKAKAIYLRQEGRSLEYVRQILIADYWRTRKLSGDECKKIMEHIQDIQPGSVSSQVTPRSLGTNPRALGTNPRAMGTNPRALGENPRARDQSE